MDKFSNNELYNSMMKRLNELLEKAKQSKKLNIERLNNDDKKTFFQKLELNSAIKKKSQKIVSLNELENKLFKFYFFTHNSFKLPTSLKDDLGNLLSLLPIEQAKELCNLINDALKKDNSSARDEINQLAESALSLINEINVDNPSFSIYDSLDKMTQEKSTFTKVVEVLRKRKIEKTRESDMVLMPKSKKSVSLSLSDDTLLKNLEEILKSGEKNKHKDIKDALNDYSKIKEAIINKNRYNQITLNLANIIADLSKISQLDLKDTILYLNKLQNMYTKELEKLTKFLANYDLKKINSYLAEYMKEKEEKQIKNSQYDQYKELAIKLETIMRENPSDLDRISEIRSQMAKVAKSSNLSNDQLSQALSQAKDEYRERKNSKEAMIESAKAEAEYKNAFERNAMIALREYAIEELEASGAFNPGNEVRNGDVYTRSVDREKLIANKIEELIKLAEMSPEQRGLYEWKKDGFVSQTTTLSDLSPRQISDLKLAYRDDSYPFMASYKKWKANSKSNATPTLQQRYIQYKASLKDKSKAISYDDFVQKIESNQLVDDIDTLSESGGPSL